jgi:hypothetical protein
MKKRGSGQTERLEKDSAAEHAGCFSAAVRRL